MGCYRGLIRVEKIIFHGLINHIITCENRYPERKPTSTRPVSGLPVPWCYMYGVGVRVSAHLRRGAAPYADASLSLLEARTHSCLAFRNQNAARMAREAGNVPWPTMPNFMVIDPVPSTTNGSSYPACTGW